MCLKDHFGVSFSRFLIGREELGPGLTKNKYFKMKIFNLIQNLFRGSILENEKNLENEKKRITKNLALVASC